MSLVLRSPHRPMAPYRSPVIAFAITRADSLIIISLICHYPPLMPKHHTITGARRRLHSYFVQRLVLMRLLLVYALSAILLMLSYWHIFYKGN